MRQSGVFCHSIIFDQPKPPQPKQTEAPAPVLAPAPLPVPAAAPIETTPGQYYVLENEYQQLVFTTQGGCLAEINLPFSRAKDTRSIVNEIEADRLIARESPANAHFPLFPARFYAVSGLQEGSFGGYYPLMRRSILGQNGAMIQVGRPRVFCFEYRWR